MKNTGDNMVDKMTATIEGREWRGGNLYEGDEMLLELASV